MYEGKKNRRNIDISAAVALKIAKSGEDSILIEKYPDTRHWTTEQRTAYLEANQPWIRAIVSSVRNIQDPAISTDDLFQEAQIAFWDAFNTYDPTRDTLFTTYAYKFMQNAVKKLLRATSASKRKPPAPTIPYDSTVSDTGEEVMGGDNMQIPSQTLAHSGPLVEELCEQREVLDAVHMLLRKQFTPEERKVFLALSQSIATQNELAKELGCSQAKISMMYKFIKIRLNYELRQMGFSNS